MILTIDPGPVESAYVLFDGHRPIRFGKLVNELMLDRQREFVAYANAPIDLAVEMIASYGMPVGAEVFQTCVWIGRFIQAWPFSHSLVYRRDVKLHLCGRTRAKDGNVRQALIDRWGGKDKAIGKKATPGPLYGISADVWQALGVAVTAHDLGCGVAAPVNSNTVVIGKPPNFATSGGTGE